MVGSQHDAGGAAGAHHFRGLIEIHGERLLAQYMLSCRGRRQHLRVMMLVGAADVERRDARLAEEVGQGVETTGNGELRGECLRQAPAVAHDADQLTLLALLDRVRDALSSDVARAHEAPANECGHLRDPWALCGGSIGAARVPCVGVRTRVRASNCAVPAHADATISCPHGLN